MAKPCLALHPQDPADWVLPLGIAADTTLARGPALFRAMGLGDVFDAKLDQVSPVDGLTLREALCCQLLAAPGAHRQEHLPNALRPPHPGPTPSTALLRQGVLWMLTHQNMTRSSNAFMGPDAPDATSSSLGLAADVIVRRTNERVLGATLLSPGTSTQLRNGPRYWSNRDFAHRLPTGRHMGWVLLEALNARKTLSTSNQQMLKLMFLNLFKSADPAGIVFDDPRAHALFFTGLSLTHFANTAMPPSNIGRLLDMGWIPAPVPSQCLAHFGPAAQPFLRQILDLSLSANTPQARNTAPGRARL